MKNNQSGSTMIVVASLVALAAIGGALFFILSSSDSDETTASTTQSEPANSQQSEESSASEDSADDNNGDYEEIELTAVNDYTGSGVAVRGLDGTTFTHQLYAQIEDPANGKFYEGWLVGENVVSTGRLEKNDDGVYYLEFTSEKDLSNLNEVVVTEETEANGLDGIPETHVLEGSF